MESLALTANSSSVTRARSFVDRIASEHLADPYPAVLLTSELVGNVVRHAGTDFTVSVEAGPPFRVEVHDGVAATEAFRELMARRPLPAPSSAPSGRGLGLVHAFASRVGLDDDPGGGKVVWFEL